MSRVRPVLFLALVAAVAGCDSGDATGTGVPAVLRVEGRVASDMWNEPLQVPVEVRVFRADGRGGWNEAEPDESGAYAMQIELRDGCEPGETLEAAAWITAPDHWGIRQDLGHGTSIVCGPETQTLDFTLSREIFRTPVPVAGALHGLQLSSGYASTCAVTSQGLYCWGGHPPRPGPVAIPGASEFQVVEGGGVHDCALDGDGAAWCWGSNRDGVLGVPGVAEADEPIPVETDLRFVELAANTEATCGREASGQLHCWGMYGDDVPVPFGGDLRFEQVSGWDRHMCGIEMGTGLVHCWGYNGWGELGLSEVARVNEPVLVQGLENVQHVAVGGAFTCALDADGAMYCWGWNGQGQHGHGEYGASPLPRRVEGVPPLIDLGLGSNFSCGLDADGDVWCSGLNDSGQLGAWAATTWSPNGTPFRSIDPVRVSGDTRFASITAGYRFGCGLTAEGEIRCWGPRRYLGIGLPPEAAAGPAS